MELSQSWSSGDESRGRKRLLWVTVPASAEPSLSLASASIEIDLFSNENEHSKTPNLGGATKCNRTNLASGARMWNGTGEFLSAHRAAKALEMLSSTLKREVLSPFHFFTCIHKGLIHGLDPRVLLCLCNRS